MKIFRLIECKYTFFIKVEIEDSFDITTKIRFSKSLETIPEALFYNEVA